MHEVELEYYGHLFKWIRKEEDKSMEMLKQRNMELDQINII